MVLFAMYAKRVADIANGATPNGEENRKDLTDLRIRSQQVKRGCDFVRTTA